MPAEKELSMVEDRGARSIQGRRMQYTKGKKIIDIRKRDS